MKSWLLTLLFATLLYSEDFISEYEYGQMLYQNPRGVSCTPCHGDMGEGKNIVIYTNEEGKKEVLSGPNITNASLEDFINAIHNGPKVMPKYFLTQKEIKAIYKFIKQVNSTEEPEDQIQDIIDIIDLRVPDENSTK